MSHYNYHDILHQLADKGRQLFGIHFRIYPVDLNVIIPLIGWMLGDVDVAAQFEIDLHKGIFLNGGVGVGKTRMMALMRCIVVEKKDYEIIQTDNITTAYNGKGPGGFSRYINDKNRSLCFDALGREDPGWHYGKSCEVMQKILFGRYELLSQFGTLTHLTSTLSGAAIENRYGGEVRSMMRELFNRLLYDKDSKDKRGMGGYGG